MADFVGKKQSADISLYIHKLIHFKLLIVLCQQGEQVFGYIHKTRVVGTLVSTVFNNAG